MVLFSIQLRTRVVQAVKSAIAEDWLDSESAAKELKNLPCSYKVMRIKGLDVVCCKGWVQVGLKIEEIVGRIAHRFLRPNW